jgi:hypothetical protein
MAAKQEKTSINWKLGMEGLLVIFVVLIWIAIVFYLARFLAGKLHKSWWRPLVRVGLFVVLLLSPVADEIVWGRKFTQLCKSIATEITVDAANTQGRTVWYGSTESIDIHFGTIKGEQSRINLVDAKTQEPLYHYYSLYVKGGWLVHALNAFEGNPPLTFNGGCRPKREKLESINKELGLTEIRRPVRY